jgi:hypothetical protein
MTATPMVSVYDGHQCIGFVLARGRRGYEAFTAGERSLGTFADKDEAARAIWRAAKAPGVA